MIEHRFGSAPPWSLGVEEELMLVDAETLEPARDGFSRLFGKGTKRIKPELFECLVEITTPVVETAEEVEAELRALRREVAERAAEHGLVLHVSGTHATARAEGQPIVPLPRYKMIAIFLGPKLYHQLICGLHVHVSVPSPDACLRAFEGVVPELPVLLADSVNSPFIDGEDSGWRSIRSQRLLEMPTGGTPPVLSSWDDWTAASRGDNTRRHWDAWPRPEYGTLEVRAMDQPTDVRRSAELAARIQELVRAAAEIEHPVYDRAVYTRERTKAARAGGGPEAERQLAVAAADGIAAVPQDVVARSVD